MVLRLTFLGVAVRAWQLGIEMRPFFNKESLWAWPVYAGVGASFGYWMLGVEERNTARLLSKRNMLLEKRRRREEREQAALGQGVAPAGQSQVAAASSME